MASQRFPPLFKYMKREHADLFFKMGTIRLGTLYEYFQTDLLGEEVGDSQEGMAFCTVKRDEIDAILAEEKPPTVMGRFVQEMLRNSPEAKLFEQFVACHMPVNEYVYCTAAEFSDEAMKKFGYDACVRIDDVGEFIKVISEVLYHFADFRGAYYCMYRDRGFRYSEAHEVFPHIIKHPRYAHQNEVRKLWMPKYPASLSPYDPDKNPYPSIAPIVFPCPPLVRLCSRLC